MTRPLRVAIVGGGPCGLLAALLLARAGVACTVFERNSGISTHPKAMGVSRRTAEIYRQIGLLDRITDGSLSVEGHVLSLWAKSLVGEELGRVPLTALHSEFTPCTSAHCPQTWTEHVLLEAVQKEPLAAVRFDAEVAGVEQDAESVRVALASGETVTAAWLIAADGAGSGVRHQLGIETDGPGDLGHFVNVMFRASYGKYLRDRQAVLYQALSEEYFAPFVAVNGQDLWLMHHFLQPGESADDFSAEHFAGLIRQASGLPDEPVEVLGLSPWVMSPKVARTFRAGRILLTGDAAARLSPAGGLGLNTGLQSVHNLAWKLAAVATGEAADSLLDSYEIERRPIATATMANTNENAYEIMAIIKAGLEGKWDTVRDGIAHSRRGGSGLGQDLGAAYATGAFVPDGSPAPVPADSVNDYLPTARPGHRAPHLPITREGRDASLLDLLGGEFVLLAGKDGTGWSTSGLATFRHGADFSAPGFETLYGLEPTGAVVVRPDGYVGARFAASPSDPAATARQAINTILGLHAI